MLFRSTNTETKAGPGPKSKAKRDKDFVGIDLSACGNNTAGQLCLLSAEADLGGEEITLRRTVLKEHPRLKIFTNLLDAHFYIFEKWVIDYITQDEYVGFLA